MARIKIRDLPKGMKISREELKRIRGGAFDAFLKIEGVSAESTDVTQKDWIEVLSYSWGVSQPASGSASSGGGRSAERADFSEFSK